MRLDLQPLYSKTNNPLSDLERFDQANSESGLLRRYVTGRVRAISARLAVAMAGCVLLMVLVSPSVGLLAGAITFPLELAEYVTLRRMLRRNVFDTAVVRRTVSIVSLIQSLGLAGCMVLAGVQSDSLRLFAWAFLFGAAINSILTAGFHPPSHKVRMAVLGLACLTILGVTFWNGNLSETDLVVEMAAIASATMMLRYLFGFLSRRDARMISAERELLVRSQEAQRLALVAKHATDSIMIMDETGKIVWINSQFSKVMGYSLKESIGRRPGELLNHPATSHVALEKLAQAALERTPVSVRILNRTKFGGEIWIESHQTPVLNEDGTVDTFIAVERDVTAIVEHEQQLKTALLAAEAAAHEKAAFLSRMSHELRTPVNGIVGGLELLEDVNIDEDQVEILAILNEASSRLIELVENIVTVADASTGKVKVRNRAMSIEDIVHSVVRDREVDAKHKSLCITTSIDPSAKMKIDSDPGIWASILDQLTGNAIKFTSVGEIGIEADITSGSSLNVRVRDTGMGISENALVGIFEKFGQADDGTTRQHDGAGLGLSLVEDLVTLLGGTISVRSTKGKGSCFSVCVPLKAPQRSVSEKPSVNGVEPVALATEESEGSKDGPLALRLLVAEDNSTNRLVIKSMLKGAGCNIQFAEDGLRAIEAYESAPPELIFMDVSMPSKNGLDATREIRELEKARHLPRCPIVAVTANVSDDDKQRCFEAGMDDFIAKPVRKENLMQAISKAMELSKSKSAQAKAGTLNR